VDVARAETQVSQNRFTLAQAQAALAAARIRLKRICGLPQDADVTLSDGLAFQPEPLPQSAAALAVARAARPELTALRVQAQQAGLGVSAARARRLPTLGVYADYGFSGNTPRINDVDTYTVAAKVSLPILSGGAIDAGVEEANSRRTQVEARLEDADAAIEEDVLVALAQAGSAAEQVRAAEATRDLAERELTLARDRFAHGVTSNVEVIEAQAALARARAGAVGALAAGQIARANLAAALGAARDFRLRPAGAVIGVNP
jgi:outer membrane protein TolC